MKTYNLAKLVKGFLVSALLITTVVACGNKDKDNQNQNAFQQSCGNCGDISGRMQDARDLNYFRFPVNDEVAVHFPKSRGRISQISSLMSDAWGARNFPERCLNLIEDAVGQIRVAFLDRVVTPDFNQVGLGQLGYPEVHFFF